MNKAIETRQVLSKKCRQNALNHSWQTATQQIDQIYSQLKEAKIIEKKNQQNKLFNNYFISGISIFVRSFYYLAKWIYLTLLVLIFMVPFMQVVKPNATNSNLKTNLTHDLSNSNKITSRKTATNIHMKASSFFYSFLQRNLSALLNFFNSNNPKLIILFVLTISFVLSLILNSI